MLCQTKSTEQRTREKKFKRQKKNKKGHCKLQSFQPQGSGYQTATDPENIRRFF